MREFMFFLLCVAAVIGFAMAVVSMVELEPDVTTQLQWVQVDPPPTAPEDMVCYMWVRNSSFGGPVCWVPLDSSDMVSTTVE